MTNHKHIKCYCDLHEMMRNGCPSARGLPCKSAPRSLRERIAKKKTPAASLPVDDKTPEFCSTCCLFSSPDRIPKLAVERGLCEECFEAVYGGHHAECIVSKIVNDSIAMSSLKLLVDKGYTEYEILYAYRRFLELYKK